MSAKRILVTGGTGYIGSHTVVELLQNGYEVVVIDNLVNSKLQVLDRIERITDKRPQFVNADLRDGDALGQVFRSDAFDAVIHFAGLKAVGESVAKPLLYYDNNVVGTLRLLEAMQAAGCHRLVFSSSATVYGAATQVPIPETAAIAPTNPYGASKAMVESILFDLGRADSKWNIVLLRYFNPVGAHDSGLMGEDPAGIPNNLMPYIAQVAVGRLKQLTIHGGDYSTRDGTGERDYIHVVDLARGHLAALENIGQMRGAVPINLGTGRGHTVREVVAAFERASQMKVATSVGPRRDGDVAQSFAQPHKAQELLGWSAALDIDRMCADAWRWQRANPNGYGPGD